MQRVLVAGMLGVSLMAGGCFGSGGGNSTKAAAGAKSLKGNQAPGISGSPPTEVLQNQGYAFTPSATDANGDRLTFSIAGKPAWATFNQTTGRLSGTPGAGHVGSYPSIRISVSDGRASASLPAFVIAVNQMVSGTVTLSWLPPTQNEDGSTLADLAGYRIYAGQSANAMTRTIVLDNPGLTRYVFEDLARATWHFAMTSVNRSGQESARSATVTKAIG